MLNVEITYDWHKMFGHQPVVTKPETELFRNGISGIAFMYGKEAVQ